MNEDQFQNDKDRFANWERKRKHGRLWMGFLLLVVGGLLFLRTANLAFFPAWLFTWPVLLLAIGLVSGARHGFRGGFWLILMAIGGFSLLNDLNPGYHLDRYEWPAVFVVLGLLFILRPRGRRRRRRGYWMRQCRNNESYAYNPGVDPAADRQDFVDVTAVFAEVKKNVMTKSFKGGDIVAFMGGSKIDMSQADFQGRVRIDVTNIFGGTKLVVPPTWDVQSDVTAIFGGVDDKRTVNTALPDTGKVLVLDGTCLFGGIEIRNY